MPRLASIDGVDIYMYFKDHAPPHIHALYGDAEVLLIISDGMLMAGALPANKLAVAKAYVSGNQAFLLTKWAEFGGAS